MLTLAKVGITLFRYENTFCVERLLCLKYHPLLATHPSSCDRNCCVWVIIYTVQMFSEYKELILLEYI